MRPRRLPPTGAADLQPENPVPWYELGLYDFNRGDRCSAYVHPEPRLHARSGRRAMDA